MKTKNDGVLKYHNSFTLHPLPQICNTFGKNTALHDLAYDDFEMNVNDFTSTRFKIMSIQNKKLVEENKMLHKKVQHLSSQLVKQDAAASCGLLVQGMVHNLNNPLSIINGRVDLLSMILQQDQKQGQLDPEYYKENLNHLKKAIANITSIVRNTLIRSLNHKSEEKKDIDINSLFEQELNFLEANPFFKHQIKLNFISQPNLPRVNAVYSDLSQIFMNIVQNSIDAMWQSKEKVLTVKTSSRNQQIIVEISDTGCGIAEENIPKIFDVFFTTKPTCSTEVDNCSPTGTGLGMYMVAKIAQEYNITYEIKSKVNEGTSSKIIIPVIYDEKI